MANSYKKELDLVKAEIKSIVAQMELWDKAIIDNAEKGAASGKMYVSGLKGTNSVLKEQTFLLKSISAQFAQQLSNTEKLSGAKQRLVNLTGQENFNNRQLAKNADLHAQSVSKLAGAYSNLVAKQKIAKKAYQDAIASGTATRAELKKLQAEFQKLTVRLGQANMATKNFSGKSLTGAVRGLKNFAAAFGVVGGAFIAADIIKKTFNLVKRIQSLNFALRTVTKTQYAFARAQTFVSKISEKYGADLLNVTERYTKFLAAANQSGVALEDTEKIFSTVTKASGVLGLKTDELTGVYLALEQMMSKGKVTTEELRRQLGERLPGAFGIMADAVGVSVRELDKMLKAGELMSAEVLPKFAAELERAYGIENVQQIQTVVAAQARLGNSFVELVGLFTEGALSNSIIAVFDGIANAVSYVADGIDYLAPAFKTLGDAVSFNIQQFKFLMNEIDPTGQALELLGKIVTAMIYGPFLVFSKLLETVSKLMITVAAANREFIRSISNFDFSSPIKSIREYSGLMGRMGDEIKKAQQAFVAYQEWLKRTEALEEHNRLATQAATLMVMVAKNNGEALTMQQALTEARKLDSDALKDKITALQAMIAAQKSARDEEEKGLKAAKGSVAQLKQSVSTLEEQRDKLATNSHAWNAYTELIRQAKEALKEFEDAAEFMNVSNPLDSMGEAKVEEIDFSNVEESYKSLQEMAQESYKDSVQAMKDSADDLEAHEDKKREDKAAKDMAAANRRIELFRTVTDTFGEYYDIDMKKFEFLIDHKKNSTAEWADAGKEAISSVLNAQLKSYEIELIEAQSARDLILNNELASEEQKQVAKERYEEKERDIKNRKAKAERRNAVINIIVDTAASAVKATSYLSNPLTAPAFPAILATILGIGAVQAGIVAAQPIPKYAEGHLAGTHEGLAMINDANRKDFQEVVERKKGGVEVYKDRNQVIDMNKGDRIHKSMESFLDGNSDLFTINMLADGKELTEAKYLENSIIANAIGKMGLKFDKTAANMEELAKRPVLVKNKVIVEQPNLKYE